MAKLQRHQSSLRRTHHQDGERHRHHRPEDGVQPERGRKAELHPEGRSDHDRAEQQDHADSGSVAGIMGTQVEAAHFARVPHFQEIVEQPPLPASRATTGQSRMKDRSGLLRQRSPRQRVATTELAPHQ